ncbi:MAG: TRAP transporter small permease [Variovorax sp.]
MIMFASIVGLVFLAAFLRTFNHPLIWADDGAKFLFSWAAFIGADIALRHNRLVGVDLLVTRAAPKVRKSFEILVLIIMMALLLAFVYYGMRLSINNWDRAFQTLSFISYSAVTLSLPVASVLMAVTCATKLVTAVQNFGDPGHRMKDDAPPQMIERSSASSV